MKRVFVLVLAAFMVFTGGLAFAQELGNSAKLIEKGKIDVGFQGVLNVKQSFSNYNLNRTGCKSQLLESQAARSFCVL